MEARPNRILVADDNAAMSNVIRFTLQRADFDVTVAKNGQLAWELVQQRQFDLIVTDQQMPLMTGIEFCRHMRTLDTYRDIPVILLTAKSMELDVAQLSEELGLAMVFPKPFSPAELVETVKNCLLQTA